MADIAPLSFPLPLAGEGGEHREPGEGWQPHAPSPSHRPRAAGPSLSRKRARGLSLIALLVLLVGCNADERGRVVRLDKGGYKGMADTVLSDATREVLRARQSWQSEGGSRAVTALGGGLIPTGEAQATGRIAGQSF